MKQAPDRKGLVLRGVAIAAAVAWVSVLFYAAGQGDEPPDVVVRPVESYDSADLRAVADELARLRGTRLTPAERNAVGIAADVVDAIASGEATVTPEATTTTAPTTTTTTTTTTPRQPTTTTTEAPSVEEYVDEITDNLLPDP